MINKQGMRLYRGLTKKYCAEEVRERQHVQLSGTDFTDSPCRALQYARGRNGTVLVVDVPAQAMEPEGVRRRVTEELYSPDEKGPRRFMLWGAFDDLLVAEIPAKDLRARVRKKGIVTLPDQDKSVILADYIRRLTSGED
jgi:hypothetical protein